MPVVPMATEPKKLDDLFLDTLKDIYGAEKQILKAQPKMVKAAVSPHLRNAFEKHRNESETHVERLGEVFELIGKLSSFAALIIVGRCRCPYLSGC